MTASPLRRSQVPRPLTGRLVPPLPAGSCDCHMHLFGVNLSDWLHLDRSYDPVPATLADYRQLKRALGLAHSVIVQPSVYGTRNDLLLATLRAAPGEFTGVVVVDAGIADAELDTMHELGVRGVRFNLVQGGGVAAADIDALAPRLAERGWHLQVVGALPAVLQNLSLLDRSALTVVIDHFGFAGRASLDPREGLDALLSRMRDGRYWMKMSALYRLEPALASDPGPLTDRLIEAEPDRLVWGSDWPHPDFAGEMPDDRNAVSVLRRALRDVTLEEKIFAANPKSLYGYGVSNDVPPEPRAAMPEAAGSDHHD